MGILRLDLQKRAGDKNWLPALLSRNNMPLTKIIMSMGQNRIAVVRASDLGRPIDQVREEIKKRGKLETFELNDFLASGSLKRLELIDQPWEMTSVSWSNFAEKHGGLPSSYFSFGGPSCVTSTSERPSLLIRALMTGLGDLPEVQFSHRSSGRKPIFQLPEDPMRKPNQAGSFPNVFPVFKPEDILTHRSLFPPTGREFDDLLKMTGPELRARLGLPEPSDDKGPEEPETK